MTTESLNEKTRCEAIRERLTLYVLNDLDAGTQAMIQTHLDGCSDCHAMAQQVRETIGTLQEALAAKPREGTATRLSSERRRLIREKFARQRLSLWSKVLQSPALKIAASVMVGYLLISLLMPSNERAYRVPKGQGEPVVSMVKIVKKKAKQTPTKADHFSYSDAQPMPQEDLIEEVEDAVMKDISADMPSLPTEPILPPSGAELPRPMSPVPGRVEDRTDSRWETLDAGVSPAKESGWQAGSAGVPPAIGKGEAESLSYFQKISDGNGTVGTDSLRLKNEITPPADQAQVQHAAFDSVAMVKSPVIMKNEYASRMVVGGNVEEERKGADKWSGDDISDEVVNGSASRGERELVNAPAASAPDVPTLTVSGYANVSGTPVPVEAPTPAPQFAPSPEPAEKPGLFGSFFSRRRSESADKSAIISEASAVDSRRFSGMAEKEEYRAEADVAEAVTADQFSVPGDIPVNGALFAAPARSAAIEKQIADGKDQLKARKLIEATEIEMNFSEKANADADRDGFEGDGFGGEKKKEAEKNVRGGKAGSSVALDEGLVQDGQVPPRQGAVSDREGRVPPRPPTAQAGASAPAKAIGRVIGQTITEDRDGDDRRNAQPETITEPQLEPPEPTPEIEVPSVSEPVSGPTPAPVLVDVDEKPDAFAPRFKATGVNPFVPVTENAFSTFSIDVDTASYTLARNYMLGGHLPPAEAVRTEEFVNFFDYAYEPPIAEPFRVVAETAPSRFGRGMHLLKIGVKGRRLGREEQRPAALTFLVDSSGSMNQPDRLGLVQKALELLLDGLADTDLVSIIQFDAQARLILEHTPVADRQRILAAVNAIQCGGGTNLEEGLRRAYEQAARNFVSRGENRILLMSDGVVNMGETASAAILAKVETYRRQGLYLSVFGVGMGIYDDDMLKTLASKGNGAYAFIDSEQEARRVFVDDLSATLNTIAEDVKIQVEYNPALVKSYRQLGYESRQLTKQQFRDDTVDAGEVGSGQSVTALYEMDLAPLSSPTLQRRGVDSDRWLAVVRVRYRRVDNGRIEEIEQRIHEQDITHSFDAASPRFRLAAGVAAFAEILRGSPFAQGVDFSDVAEVLRPVALDLHLDSRLRELVQIVETAGGLAR